MLEGRNMTLKEMKDLAKSIRCMGLNKEPMSATLVLEVIDSAVALIEGEEKCTKN